MQQKSLVDFGETFKNRPIGRENFALLDEGASVGDLLVALAEPEKQQLTKSGCLVSTVHSFKGRQAGTIFLPCWEDGAFPRGRADCNLAEERRIAYVAVTRVEQDLFISWARTRQENFGRQETMDRQPSRFIGELGVS